MKTKLLSLLFGILIIFALTACGNEESTTSNELEEDATTDNSDEEVSGDEAKSEIDYPTRDLQVIVGHGAGGGTDTFTRQISQQMEEILGVSINVVNKEGAGGAIAKEYAANEAADGYTLVATASLPYQVALGTNTDNQLNIFSPLARVQSDTAALQVKKGAFEGIDDFIEQAENNPGTVKVGGTGIGTIDDILLRMLKDEAGLDIIFVPFEGAGPMHAALLGGHIDAMIEEVGPTVSLIEGEETELILFFAEERPEDFPDVPTSVEQGWDITHGAERGLSVHKDTPQEIKELLEQTIKEAAESEEYKEYEKNSYLHLRDGWLGSEDYYEKLKSDIEVFTEILSSVEE